MDNNRLKKYYEMFTDVWKLFRKYSSPDESSEFWSHYTEEVEKLNVKYENSELFQNMVLAVTKELTKIEKEGT